MNGDLIALNTFWRRRIHTLVTRRWQMYRLSLDKTSLFYFVLLATALGLYYGTSTITGLVRSVPWHPWLELLSTLILFWGLVSGEPSTWLKEPDTVFLQPLNQRGRKFVTRSLLFGWGLAALRLTFLFILVFGFRYLFLQPSIHFPVLFILWGLMIQWMWRLTQLWVRQRIRIWPRRLYRWASRLVFYPTVSFVLFRWISFEWTTTTLMMVCFLTGIMTVLVTWRIYSQPTAWGRLIEEESDRRTKKEAGLLGGMQAGSTGVMTTQFPFFKQHLFLAYSPTGGLLLRYSRRLVRRRREMVLLGQILTVYLLGTAFLRDGKFTFVTILFGMIVMSRYFREQWNEGEPDYWMCEAVTNRQHQKQAITISLRLGLIILFTLPALFSLFLGQFFRHPALDLLLLAAMGEGIVRFRSNRG